MSNLDLRILSSLAKVFPDHAPPAKYEKEWLNALCGETVSVQAAYKFNVAGARSWASLRISAQAR